MAQGLHDSIAQGLNFLNLQVQMLEDSQKRGQFTEVEDIIPLLRAGVQESYRRCARIAAELPYASGNRILKQRCRTC
jgi:nitrate/nitrite-specific signal transduction histidine kinase